ncbi:hypothetical protein DV736_g4198, partial [Chaetothyriales sp. CBS 134916]
MGVFSFKLDSSKKSSNKDSPQGSKIETPSHHSHNPFISSADPSANNSLHASRSESPEAMGNRQTRSQALDLVKNQVMINYLYQQQGNNGWRSSQPGIDEGVLLRVTRENYLAFPPELTDTNLAAVLRELNVQSAMTIHSQVIKSYLLSMPHATELPLLNGLAVQVVPTVQDLAKARVHHFAAVVASEGRLVVWDDDAVNMLNRAKTIEWELMQLLWTTNTVNSKTASKVDLTINEKEEVDSASEESAAPKPRPTIFINTVLVSLSLCLMISALGLGVRKLVVEMQYEKGSSSGSYTRLAFLALTPLWMFLGMFFFNALVASIAQCIGPIQQMNINSKHYSAIPVQRITRDFPHVTIQCPVYKESLAEVIQPTIVSIKKAISTYELQGGSANIFINDDGLQLIDDEQREERMAFYANNGIGWVARPPHSSEPGGFQRKGKFKKASNMNFALALSCSMEDKLLDIKRGSGWTSVDEADATSWALEQAVADTNGLAWADGNIRIGDYILLIDSDTRVPVDCFLDAVSELESAPEVAILQFSSGVMNVTDNYFEMGITFFTNLIYSSIRFGVANGDVAPFVGHNAILRWSALQDVSFEEDGRIKFWSESHVSEDFDMALRCQIKGYITRLAAWAGDGFQEGVSLTVYDELARWQKYAYGCNELVFHPYRFWFIRGPITPLFIRFLRSNMPIASKINIISYIGTYYAIGGSWIMTLANYFLVGWFQGYLDKYYLDSWNIWITVLVVFTGLGNVALATLRYRTGERSFLGALYENFKWLFMFFIFLGGISIHVSEALLAHGFEVNMTWGATAKTLEFTNFFKEVPRTLRKFWFSFTVCILMIATMIIMARASFVPYSWHITQLSPLAPLCSMVAAHILLPLALNPGLMTFAW